LHRRPLLELLGRYAARTPAASDDRARAVRMRRLVEARPDCFERTCLPGHVTASAWILSADGRRFLLTHHRKLGRWLQLGGHADGDPDVRRVALREAREESGLRHLAFGLVEGEAEPVDVDVHPIPERPGEPAHEHHDVRFVLRAARDEPLQRSPESIELAWFGWEQLEAVADDESVLRLGRKVRALLPALATRSAEEVVREGATG